MPEPTDISAILVSHNTRQMTLDCLRALFAELKDVRSEVFVVDNGSSDESPAAIRTAFPQIALIENQRNVGFGAGNNLAMRRASGRYLLLINTDAFVQPRALRECLGLMEREPQVAVVGPRLLNRDGSLQRSCFRFPSPTRAWLENLWASDLLRFCPSVDDYKRWPHDAERDVDFVSGACLLVRRAAYEQVGGFDERFFMYAEETDWQRRMRENGWAVIFTPHAEVIHWGGSSGRERDNALREAFFTSLDRYELKHHGIIGLFSVRLAMVVGCGFRAIAWGFVYILSPTRRVKALFKLRLHSWLLTRQASRWCEAFHGAEPEC